ncbi:MAG: MaoC/PaaZ C-terminal domain-containing protein [Pseudomonadota bacterium]
MEISPEIVGFEVPERKHRIHWRETTSFAAATGDANPRYLDDTVKGGLVAPPLFAVTLTWPLISDLPRVLPEVLTPDIVATMVHANEHLIFHEPIRPGDKLHLRGRIEGLVPTQAGAFLVMRSEGVIPGRGPMFTEYGGVLFRGVKVGGDARLLSKLPEVPKPMSDGAPLWQAEIPVERTLPFIYDGCTGIVFPIHTSVRAAKEAGLPDIVLQGTATLALAARQVVNSECDGIPFALKEIACRFTGLVVPGTPVHFRLLGRDRSQGRTGVYFDLVVKGGNPALSGGFASVEVR